MTFPVFMDQVSARPQLKLTKASPSGVNTAPETGNALWKWVAPLESTVGGLAGELASFHRSSPSGTPQTRRNPSLPASARRVACELNHIRPSGP
jgi:hypothetical protein